MRTKVNKQALETLIQHLRENRTNHNVNGNYLHNRKHSIVNQDPFGADEEEEDIVYNHMASFDMPIRPNEKAGHQISIPRPPVEDPDFVPKTNQELASSAVVLSREVPEGQIDYFYRELHKLLDGAMDNEEMKSLDSINETYNITKKTKISDLKVVSEARAFKRTKSGRISIPGKSDASTQEKELLELPEYLYVVKDRNDYDSVPEYSQLDENQKLYFETGYDVGILKGEAHQNFALGNIDQSKLESTMRSVEIALRSHSANKEFMMGFNSAMRETTAQEKESFKRGLKLGNLYAEAEFQLKDGEISQEQFESDMNKYSKFYQAIKNNEMAMKGFNLGIEIDESDMGMDVHEKERQPFPHKDDTSEDKKDIIYDADSYEEWVATQGLTWSEKNDPQLKAKIQSFLAVQLLSQNLENDYNKAMTTYFQSEGASAFYSEDYVKKHIKPTILSLKMTQESSLVILRVKELLKTSSKDQIKRMKRYLMATKKMKQIIVKMLKFHYKNSAAYQEVIEELAVFMNYDVDNRNQLNEIINMIALDLAKGFANVGRRLRFVAGVDDTNGYMEKAIKAAMKINFYEAVEDFGRENLRIAIAASGGNKLDKDQIKGMRMPWDLNPKAEFSERVYLKYLQPEFFEDYKERVYSSLQEKYFDGQKFILRDEGRPIPFSKIDFDSFFEAYFLDLEEKVNKKHKRGAYLEDDIVDIDSDDTFEELASDATMKKIETRGRIIGDTDWTSFDKLFGRPGASTMRQWFLKYPQRKVDFIDQDDMTGETHFLDFQDELFDILIDPVLDLINSGLLSKYQRLANSPNPKQQTIGGRLKSVQFAGDKENYSFLKGAIKGLEELQEETQENDKLVSQLALDGSPILKSLGGKLLRQMVGDIMDPVFKNLEDVIIDEYWGYIQEHAENVKEDLEEALENEKDPEKRKLYESQLKVLDTSEKTSRWACYYLMGQMKEIKKDDFKNLTKGAKTLMKSGIYDFETYEEFQKEMNEMIPGISKKYFSYNKKVDANGKTTRKPGKLRKLAFKAVLKMVNNEKELQKYIEKAIAGLADDIRLIKQNPDQSVAAIRKQRADIRKQRKDK